MINKNNLDELRSEITSFDEQRDLLIKDSRNVVKSSKIIIYALHRDEITEAEKSIEKIKDELKELEKYVKDHSELRFSGSFKIAEQEYAEAMCFYYFIKENRLVTNKELNLDAESYLLGVFDLTGELVRKAINSAIKKDYGMSLKIKDFVSDLYGELLKFEFRNGNLRKKFDSIKYDLKKLEDLVYDLKTKGLI